MTENIIKHFPVGWASLVTSRVFTVCNNSNNNIIKHFPVGWASLVTSRVFTVCNNSNNNNYYNNNFMNQIKIARCRAFHLIH